MKLTREDRRLRIVVLLRDEAGSTATFHDAAGEVCATLTWEGLVAPPVAREAIASYGYALTPWVRAEPGIYTADIEIWNARRLGAIGGWEKDSHLAKTKSVWDMTPEMEAAAKESSLRAAEKSRAREEAYRARLERRSQLEPGRAYSVKARPKKKGRHRST